MVQFSKFNLVLKAESKAYKFLRAINVCESYYKTRNLCMFVCVPSPSPFTDRSALIWLETPFNVSKNKHLTYLPELVKQRVETENSIDESLPTELKKKSQEKSEYGDEYRNTQHNTEKHKTDPSSLRQPNLKLYS